jgi:hypothetical protein
MNAGCAETPRSKTGGKDWATTEGATEPSTSAEEHIEEVFWAEFPIKRATAEWTRRES